MRYLLVGCVALLAAAPASAQFKFAVEQKDGVVKHPGDVRDLVYSPDSKTVASVCEDFEVHLYHVETKRTIVVRDTARNGRPLLKLTFTADGKYLLLGNCWCAQAFVAATGEPHATFGERPRGQPGDSYTGAFVSPDGKNLVTVAPKDGPAVPSPTGKGSRVTKGTQTTVNFWDIEGKKLLQSTDLDGRMAFGRQSVAYAPDGRSFAVQLDKDLGLVDGKTGRALTVLKNVLDGGCHTLIYMPDGQSLYANVGNEIQPISLKNLEAPRILTRFPGPGALVPDTYLTPDGTRWLVKKNGFVYGWLIYDRASLKLVAEVPGAITMRLSADGKTAVYVNALSQQFVVIDPATGRERGFATWPATSRFISPTTGAPPQHPQVIALAPDGGQIAYIDNSTVELRDLGNRLSGHSLAAAQVVPLPAPFNKENAVRNVLVSQDEGTVLLFGGDGVGATVFDGKTFQPRVVLRDPVKATNPLARIHLGSISADGATAVLVADVWGPRGPGELNKLVVADLKTGQTRLLDPRGFYHRLAASADGKHLVAIVNDPGEAHAKMVFQGAGAKAVTLKTKMTGFFDLSMAVSDDGKWVCGWVTDERGNGSMQVWDTATGEAGSVAGKDDWGPRVGKTFLADNKTVAFVTAGRKSGRTLVRADAATGQRTGEIKDFDRNAGPATVQNAVSPSGRHLVAGNLKAEMYLYDGSSGAVLARLAGHTGGIYLTRFTPSGRRVISVANDGTLRLWDVPAN